MVVLDSQQKKRARPHQPPCTRGHAPSPGQHSARFSQKNILKAVGNCSSVKTERKLNSGQGICPECLQPASLHACRSVQTQQSRRPAEQNRQTERVQKGERGAHAGWTRRVQTDVPCCKGRCSGIRYHVTEDNFPVRNSSLPRNSNCFA